VADLDGFPALWAWGVEYAGMRPPGSAGVPPAVSPSAEEAP